MPTLYLIDILDDPDQSFEQVFQDFLDHENIERPYYCIDGLHPDVNYDLIFESDPGAIIISGSLQSVYDQAPWMQKLQSFIQRCHQRNLPVLGLCFGHQILAAAMGGKVENLDIWEFGVHPIYLANQAQDHPWLQGLPAQFETLQVHQDHVSTLPPEATSLASSEKTPHQIFSLGSLMGVQFHPEYTVDILHTIVRNRPQKFIKKGPFTSEAHLQALSRHWSLPELPRQILKNFLKDTLDVS